MNQLFRQNLVEALVGAFVLIVAVVAALFFYQKTSAEVGDDNYVVDAMFENASGVSIGTDVRVSGITVGSIVEQSLEGEFPFRAKLGLSIDSRYKLPLDSSAAITSEGILGGNYVALSPGGDPETLRDGDEILDTQGSVDMLGLIGSYINNTGSEDAPAEASVLDEGGFGTLEDAEEELGGDDLGEDAR
ncbi:MAG: outer membrane lipid asymmetry maintenance protein MlaD [Pacificimonas sp.]